MRGHTLCNGVSNEGLLQPKGLKQAGIKEGFSINKLHICASVRTCVCVCVCVCVHACVCIEGERLPVTFN